MDLVQSYASNLQAGVQKTLDTDGDASVSVADWLMVHKVKKHLAAGNQRKAASYVAMRLEEDASPLSEWACKQMRQTPLKASRTQVQYTNPEGVLRAFGFTRAK